MSAFGLLADAKGRKRSSMAQAQGQFEAGSSSNKLKKIASSLQINGVKFV